MKSSKWITCTGVVLHWNLLAGCGKSLLRQHTHVACIHTSRHVELSDAVRQRCCDHLVDGLLERPIRNLTQHSLSHDSSKDGLTLYLVNYVKTQNGVIRRWGVIYRCKSTNFRIGLAADNNLKPFTLCKICQRIRMRISKGDKDFSPQESCTIIQQYTLSRNTH